MRGSERVDFPFEASTPGRVIEGCMFIYFNAGKLWSLRRGEGGFFFQMFSKFQGKLGRQNSQHHLSLSKCLQPKSQSLIFI